MREKGIETSKVCGAAKKLITENDVLFKVAQAYLENGIPVLLSGVEPKTFRLLVRML